MYTYIPSLGPPSHPRPPFHPSKVTTGHPAELPAPYSSFPLQSVLQTAVYSCQSQSPNSFHSPLPSPLTVSTVHYLHLHLYFCPANRFICTIFSRFHIYSLIFNICFCLSDLLHSVLQTSSVKTSIHISTNDPTLFLFIDNIYIYIYTTSLSILDGHLGYFHVLAIVNSASNGMHACFWIIVFLEYICPGVGLLDFLLALFLVF